MTVYAGGAQATCLIGLDDALRALAIVLEDPSAPGTMKVVHSASQVAIPVLSIAHMVKRAASSLGIDASIDRTSFDPRGERRLHQGGAGQPAFSLCRDFLSSRMTFRPFEQDIVETIRALQPLRNRIDTSRLVPQYNWCVAPSS